MKHRTLIGRAGVRCVDGRRARLDYYLLRSDGRFGLEVRMRRGQERCRACLPELSPTRGAAARPHAAPLDGHALHRAGRAGGASVPLTQKKQWTNWTGFDKLKETKQKGKIAMKCPYCSYPESKVVDSRHSDDGLSIRRRRECLQCQRRFTTYETVESLPIVVVKKDGSRQSFDRNKILNGMLRACEKRPVSLAALETAALDIEQILQNSLEREVSTGQIGELVMERLKPLDEVAYVRFASVYRQFKDINSFMRELNKILEEK